MSADLIKRLRDPASHKYGIGISALLDEAAAALEASALQEERVREDELAPRTFEGVIAAHQELYNEWLNRALEGASERTLVAMDRDSARLRDKP